MSFDNVAWRPMHYSISVEIGSDFADAEPGSPMHWQHNNVGFWSREEARLLRDIAAQFRGHWIEIGSHTGWTAAQIVAAGATVTTIDPMFASPSFFQQFARNMNAEMCAGQVIPWPGQSDWYFEHWVDHRFIGGLIDGDHDHPHPLRDAINCYRQLEQRGVIVLHDFRGPGPWAAGEYLAKQGMQYKIYGSVHMVAVFWRGEFTPPPEIVEGNTNWTMNYGLPEWMK